MPLAAHTRLGPYEILGQLGAGGMGEVYRARDTRLDRDVAVKVLPTRFAQDPQMAARFRREVKAIAGLSHPNITSIFDVGTEQGSTYAVMELLEGETVGTRLKRSLFGWQEAVEIGASIADGLAAAHEKGIIHRDIKPENVFLTRSGTVKILDFGLARVVSRFPDSGTNNSNLSALETQPGLLLGTVAYMSPEQVRGEPADARSDLFALGCILYEMVTGRRPFYGRTPADTMVAILNETPQPLSQSGRERPAELDRIIQQCLEKDPTRRFSSAREIAWALRKFGRQTPGPNLSPHQDTVIQGLDSGTQGGYVGPSVAVLPFRNMSSDPENEYFSDGLAEELIGALTKIEGLQVASRTSAFAFKGRNEDVRKIGQQLAVRAVLEGSVRKAGNRLRISAQLVNVSDGYHLWSETFNREMADIFEIQDEIAQNIAKALRVILSDKDKPGRERIQTTDVRAYELYLRGRQYFHQFRRRGYEFALQMFRDAIAIDPSYALAYAGIADCYSLLYMYWDSREANIQNADEASRRALELAPSLAEAHVARGMALSLQKQITEAAQEFESAIQLDPTLFEAHYFYGRACQANGRPEEAAMLFEQACQLRPDDYQPATHLVSLYAGLGRSADAQAVCQRCVGILKKHLSLHPDDARAWYLGAIVLCQLGEPDRGVEWADRALAMDPDEPVTLYNVACVYALQGKTDQAIDCLERAIRHGFGHKEWIENDADLAPLREHPRYHALLAAL